MVASLAVPMFLLIFRRQALLFVQWMTYAGIIIWIKAGIDYVNLHMVPGGNYFTIVIFFSLVALWTVASSLLLYTDDFRRVYRWVETPGIQRGKFGPINVISTSWKLIM